MWGGRELSSVEVYDPGAGESSAAAALTTALDVHRSEGREGKRWVGGGIDADDR